MGKIAVAIAGIFMIYPAIYVTGIFKTWAETYWTLGTWGELLFGVLPFAVIAGFIFGIYRAIAFVTKDKEGKE